MTCLPDHPHTALLVIDVQVDVVAQACRRQEVIDHIAALVERARAAEVPVVWVQHHGEGLTQGTAGWSYVPELERRAGEPLVHKEHSDAFAGTTLEDVLAEHGVGHLVVVGAQTDMCIRGTLHGGLARGYDMTLVSDAHTTEDQTPWGAPPPQAVIAHTNLYWAQESAPGCRAAVVETAQVVFDPGARRGTPA